MTYRWSHSLALVAAVLLIGVCAFADSPMAGVQADSTIQADSGLTGDRSMDTGSPAGQGIGFRLVGTAVSDDAPEKSLAVMEHQSTGKQGAYSEGDQLGEFMVMEILHGKVIIATVTGDVVLSMNSGSYAGGLVSNPGTGKLSAEEVEAVIPDYEALMYQIRVRSYFAGGRLAGFVIYKIEPGSIFERMGLKNGDVIESVNGKFFATTQPVVEFYDALMESETVALEILRDNSRKGLLFNIQ